MINCQFIKVPETCSCSHDDGDRRLPDQDAQRHQVTGQGWKIKSVLKKFVDEDHTGQADVEVEEIGAEANEIGYNLQKRNE